MSNSQAIRIACSAAKCQLLNDEARKLSSYRNYVFIPSYASYDFVRKQHPPGVAFFVFGDSKDAMLFKLSFWKAE